MSISRVRGGERESVDRTEADAKYFPRARG